MATSPPAHVDSFGLLKHTYRLTPDRITISRNVWLPFALVAFGIAGGVLFGMGMTVKHGDNGAPLLVVGFIGIMAGLFALVMTPWTLPGMIVLTREGLTYGGRKVPVAQLAQIRTRVSHMRAPNGRGYDSWSLMVVISGKSDSVYMNLGNRQANADAAPLERLGRAMATMIGKPY